MRHEQFHRRKYQEYLNPAGYTSPPFRFPGFWPGNFGYHPTQQAQLPVMAALQQAIPAGEGAPAQSGRARAMLGGGGGGRYGNIE